MGIINRYRLGRADFDALAAADTLDIPRHNNRRRRPRFRVGAPLASQRATLHENRCPDSWTVMNAEPLNIKYQTFTFFRFGFSHLHVPFDFFSFFLRHDLFVTRLLPLKTLLGSCDNVVLEAFAEIHKISTVTRHPDDQIGVLFRVFLGVQKRCPVDHIKLNMGYSQIRPGF